MVLTLLLYSQARLDHFTVKYVNNRTWQSDDLSPVRVSPLEIKLATQSQIKFSDF